MKHGLSGRAGSALRAATYRLRSTWRVVKTLPLVSRARGREDWQATPPSFNTGMENVMAD